MGPEASWTAVDFVGGGVGNPEEYETRARRLFTYVIAVDNRGCVIDVTERCDRYLV
jgi:hypothetical protein